MKAAASGSSGKSLTSPWRMAKCRPGNSRSVLLVIFIQRPPRGRDNCRHSRAVPAMPYSERTSTAPARITLDWHGTVHGLSPPYWRVGHHPSAPRHTPREGQEEAGYEAIVPEAPPKRKKSPACHCVTAARLVHLRWSGESTPVSAQALTAYAGRRCSLWSGVWGRQTLDSAGAAACSYTHHHTARAVPLQNFLKLKDI